MPINLILIGCRDRHAGNSGVRRAGVRHRYGNVLYGIYMLMMVMMIMMMVMIKVVMMMMTMMIQDDDDDDDDDDTR